MKKIMLLLCFSASVANVFAQKETFDLTTYTAPIGWKKEVKEDIVSYTISNTKTKSWCVIHILKSTISKGSIEKDFESEWNELIIKSYNVAGAQQTNKVQEAAGWKIKKGTAKFTFSNANATAILSTMSGYERCVSIVATTNSKIYLKNIEAFLSSIELKKPQTPSAVQAENPQPGNNNSSIVGTWTAVSSDQDSYLVKNAVAGNIRRQYTFINNGTYKHAIKTFSFFTDLLLTQESGTYQVSGSTFTISPQKAVIESWSKKDGRDEWGKRLSSQNATMEKTTYQFTIEYNAYISETQLILQASKATKRDGHFDRDNKWFYKLPTSDYDFIKLPK